MASKVKLIECPRDAMQGLKSWIPTEAKARYINKLLQVGFDTVDFGSFVSPKAIPQMKDSAEVLDKLELEKTGSSLLAIVANKRGAVDACHFEQIDYLGYPFSISETFQQRNTNASIEESIERLQDILDVCKIQGKELVVYISMGFGNPYGDEWNVDIVIKWAERLSKLGIRILSLSDTIGVANPESIQYLFSSLIPALPGVEFGAHLHTQAHNWKGKVKSAYESGCRRYDGAVRGYGGCPMAKDDLTGNMPTENMLYYFGRESALPEMDHKAFNEAMIIAAEIFPEH